jgi:hypothetical protein
MSAWRRSDRSRILESEHSETRHQRRRLDAEEFGRAEGSVGPPAGGFDRRSNVLTLAVPPLDLGNDGLPHR